MDVNAKFEQNLRYQKPKVIDLTSNINKLETGQRRSARHIMHNYSRHASVTTMLQHLDLPTLQQRRQHSKIIMLYRITHKLASIPTATYIAPCIRNTQHYILPYARTHVFKTSFFPSTIKIWNNLQPVNNQQHNHTTT